MHITKGHTATFLLAAGNSLQVLNQATVKVFNRDPTLQTATFVSQTSVPTATSKTFGPYTQTTELRVFATSTGVQATETSGVSAPASFVTNWKISNTNKWRAARGKVQSGTSNAKLLCVGNSITAGYGATGSTSTGNPASKSYPTSLANILTANGLTASWQSWIGGQSHADFAAFDARLNMGTWTNSNQQTIGSNVVTSNSTGATAFTFTPTTAVDTVEVLILRTGSGGVAVSNDASATLGTVLPASGTGTHYLSTPITLDGGVGTKVIKAVPSVSNTTYLNGMIAYNSAVKEVSVLRAGWTGALASYFNSGNFPWYQGMLTVAPDLTLIAMTRNDPSQPTALATFKANYQLAINSGKTSGDVVLVIEPIGDTAQLGVYRNFQAYYTAVYEMAADNDLPVIDFTRLWDDYDAISTWFPDGVHPSAFGYAEMAQQIADVLLK